ncbi:MAG: serine/threonine protein kinase [Gammaproteobacteria bacterium]|nr:serine/threonine protein kinase [Gammaproteobacteria bacterium]
MNEKIWQKIQSLFEEALSLPPDQRDSFLDERCAGDLELRSEVAVLLENDPDSTSSDKFADSIERFASVIDADNLAGAQSNDAGAWRGKQLGVYKIIDKIAEGGMGAVFLAERDDKSYEHTVAIKLVGSAGLNEDLKRRFIGERQILANLDHTNIARLIDGGETDSGTPYIVMEYVRGESIDVYCDQHRLTIDERLDLFNQVCDAVQYAHQNLIIHRDIKPSNVLVTADGVSKLIDFGIAKLIGPDIIAKTQAGRHVMTPKHASPEQLLGKKITTATDVYALGILLYELLSGSFPFDLSSSSVDEIKDIAARSNSPLPSISATRPVAATIDKAVQLSSEDIAERRRTTRRKLTRILRGDLDAIVLKAIDRNPTNRYVTVRQFQDDIRRYREDRPIDARVGSLSYRVSKTFARYRTTIVGAAVLLAVAVGALSFHNIRLSAERDNAQQEALKANKVASLLAEVLAAASPSQTRGTSISAESLLDHGVQRIRDDLAEDPELMSDLLAVVGGTYRSLGLFQKAHDLVIEVLQIRERLLPSSDPRIAESYYELGYTSFELGLLEKSLTAHQKALALYQEMGIEGSNEKVAASLREIGLLHEKFHNFAEAERYYVASLEQMKALYPEGGQEIALTQTDYAGILFRTQRYAEAEPLLIDALNMRRRLLGDIHPDVAQGLNNIGVFYFSWGDMVSAEAFIREGLPMRIALWGDDNSRTALVRSNLAQVLLYRGKNSEALALLERALPELQEGFGPNHDMTFVAADRKILALMKVGQIDEAILYGTRMMGAVEVALGSDSYSMADFQLNLGRAYTVKGNLQTAREMLVKARDIFSRIRGEEHVVTFQARLKLADIAALEGSPDVAIAEYERFLELHQSILHEHHPDISEAHYRLGELYAETDDPGSARGHFAQALAAYEESQYPESPMLVKARNAVLAEP